MILSNKIRRLPLTNMLIYFVKNITPQTQNYVSVFSNILYLPKHFKKQL